MHNPGYGDTAVLLSWTTPATGTPGGYKVEVSEDAGITWADAEDDTGSTDTSWIHEGLPAAATRHYRVSALVSGEASDPSATASATYSGTNFNYTWSTPPFGPWSNDQVVAFEFAATFPPPNTAPVFDPASYTRSVNENTAAAQSVGSPVTATDADTGDTLTYSLGGTDASSFDIVSTSG